MTAFPDQPWSRRPETTDTETTGTETTDTGADVESASDPAGQAADADASPTSSADAPAEPPRRRMTPLSPGAPAEPLIYQTQQRVPGEPGSFRPRRPQPELVEDDPLPPTQALPAQDAPQYRRRDFSPEGRRAVPSWAPAYAQGDGGYPSSERLDYTTLGHQEVRAAVEGSRGAHDEDAADAGRSDGGSVESTPVEAPASGAIPMSTPEQPLTRRQLRALREAQEREERGESAEGDAPAGRDGSGEAAVTDAPVEAAAEDDRPAARPWPSVFYTEPVAEPAEGTADEPVVPEQVSVDPAAPATFAVPVQQPAQEADAPRADESLDDWVAKVFDGTGEVPTADAPPLVEPPEPAHWDPDAGSDQAGSPAVFDALFTPPSQAEPEPAAPVAGEPAAAETNAAHPAAVDPADPLAFLGAQPAPSDRVDLPAPPAWGAPPTDAADPTAEEIVVEESTVPEDAAEPSAADEVHPVVVDIHPLPAEPIERAPSGEVPTGHWTQQAAAEEDSVTLSRDVAGGHGVVTTNALVLPSIPQQELAGPLTNTGEILLTGSIDVPRSLSSTGAHPTQLDETRLDHELDFGDQQVVSADSQPIRAIKAVSTHTSTRGMMLTQKPRGNRSLTVLIIVTAALAVGVGVVLVVGLLNNAF